ncbi:MAG: Lar family restriction alleviation protein [Deltaproteobacteria bacterium]|nr:Lar family restriction alleviation protein [Deltaproteobacteria bacterium]
MKKERLLPCPFCGGKAKLATLWIYIKKDGTQGIAAIDGEEPWRRVRCEMCGAGSKALPRQDSVAAWNQRRAS